MRDKRNNEAESLSTLYPLSPNKEFVIPSCLTFSILLILFAEYLRESCKGHFKYL